MRAWPKGSEKAAIPFLTNSWVADGFGGRIFFTGTPTLPAQTPDGLMELRQLELNNLRVGIQRHLAAALALIKHAFGSVFLQHVDSRSLMQAID